MAALAETRINFYNMYIQHKYIPTSRRRLGRLRPGLLVQLDVDGGVELDAELVLEVAAGEGVGVVNEKLLREELHLLADLQTGRGG